MTKSDVDGVVYQFTAVLHLPSEDTGDLYMMEIPELPGCRAWGESPNEALDYLRSVAAGFIELYREQGIPIPVDPAPIDSAPRPVQVYA